MTTTQAWIAPEQGLTGVAPHRLGADTHHDIVRAWILAASVVGLAGVILFGRTALELLIVSSLSAVASEVALGVLMGRRGEGRLQRAFLYGLLLGLTLPATAPWYVAVIGSVIAIAAGVGVFGGLLHPTLVGRVVVQFLFANRLGFAGALAISPVLAPGHLLWGDLSNHGRVSNYQGWLATPQPDGKDALLLERPVLILRHFAQRGLGNEGDLRFEPLVRDALPPWTDTVLGTVAGNIGETCTLAILLMGLYLIYRGYLRWQLPVAVLAAAALAASILPVELSGHYRWFPALEFEQGRAVGLAYVLYHLTAGQIMLGAFLLAGDVIASPVRVQGQLIFAAGIGVLTIFMRLYGVLEGECYWSILIMNALVGTIDRRTKRPILGFG
ncbi:MAG: RnfABCDGE type electron transport complex subunit D [Phycisphaerae bacterium]